MNTTKNVKSEHTNNKGQRQHQGFIAIYNPGTLNARAEVHYNEPYTDDSTGTYLGITSRFEDLSAVFECDIQIFDLETGELIMLHAGR